MLVSSAAWEKTPSLLTGSRFLFYLTTKTHCAFVVAFRSSFRCRSATSVSINKIITAAMSEVGGSIGEVRGRPDGEANADAQSTV